jgi:hypothetical protein
VIACPSHSTLRLSINVLHSLLTVLASLGHDLIGLISVLCCQLTVLPQYLALGQEFLLIPRAVGSDLRGRCAIDSLFPQMVLNLFSSRTGRLEILFGVPADFRLAMLAALQFIPQQCNRIANSDR